MPDLEFRGVTRVHPDGSQALRGVGFTVPAGQLTTIVGPSGSGKSTLLRIAAGLEAATTGSVFLGGRDIATLPPQARDITLLFQAASLFPHLDVLGNIAFGLRQQGVDARQAGRQAQRMLELVGLQGAGRARCDELSGGQQQRVALARALALEPSTLLLDEPLSNLDDRLRRRMRDEIRDLQRHLGLTMAYVTHDQAEAMAVGDSLVVLHEGRLLQQGTPREVYERPASEFVGTFMGDAATFDLCADADGRLFIGPAALPLPAGHPPCAPGQRVRVMLRPEAWRISAVGERPGGLPGRIERCAYLGHAAEYVVGTQLGELLVLTRRGGARHAPGAPVSLSLEGNGVILLGAPPA